MTQEPQQTKTQPLQDAPVTADAVREAIEDAVDMILDRYGVSALAPSEQDDAIDQIGELLTQEIIMHAVDRMDEARAPAFSAFMDTNPTEVDVLKRLVGEDPEFVESIDMIVEDFIAESDYLMG
jgi:hypothetical protein